MFDQFQEDVIRPQGSKGSDGLECSFKIMTGLADIHCHIGCCGMCLRKSDAPVESGLRRVEKCRGEFSDIVIHIQDRCRLPDRTENLLDS